MNVPQWAQKHERSILFILACLGIAGIISVWFVPVSLFPQVSFPRIVVSLDSGDYPAERMAIEVTRPVENAVRAVKGVRSIRSKTTRGTTDISVNFHWGRNMITAMLEIQSAVNQVLNKLPAGTQFEVRKMDTTVFPILGYSLTSQKHTLTELKDIAQYKIRPALSTISGIAKVAVLGGDRTEYHILVDPVRLHSFGLDMHDVAESLSKSNVLTAVGRLEQHYKLYLAIADNSLTNIEEIGQTIIRSGKNGLVRINNIATIKKGVAPRWNRVTANGNDAVLFQIYQQPDGNTVQIIQNSDARLQTLKQHLPRDIHIDKWYDQSELVIASAQSVFDALWIGVLLAGIVLLLFLKDWRITFIAVLTVPLVLSTTVLILKILGMSFNIMTLGGMAAAVALIVDDVIVMIEHIMRRVQNKTDHYHARIMVAANEFTRPLAGSSASTIIIFTPLAFLNGVTGAFFKALSLTMASGLIVSFLFAWIAVPLLAKYLLRQTHTQNPKNGAITTRIHLFYHQLMRYSFQHSLIIIFLFLLPLFALGFFAYNHIGSGFMPEMDEGGFILDYRTPSGTSLTETDRLLRQVEDILQKTPEVSTYSRRTGLALDGLIAEANEGDFFVRLTPFPRRPLDEVMDDIRQQIITQVPGLDIEMAKLMADLIGDLTAVPQPIEIKLFSDDEKLLTHLAPIIADKLKKIKGVVDVADGIVPAGDALKISVDISKAALEGVDPQKVTDFLESHLAGIVATNVETNSKMVGVRVWTPPSHRISQSNIANMYIQAADKHLVPVKRITHITREIGQPQITRENFKRMIAVTGRISGRDMGSTVKDILKILHQPALFPQSVEYTLGGLYEQQQIAFRGLMLVFISAALLIFALFLFLYESFRVAVIMLSIPLLALPIVFVSLWLTNTDLNITSMMGMTMIIGIISEVSIFYYSEFIELNKSLPVDQRLILAGKQRMRPIAMTTIAAILALSPLALGLGEGSAMLQPLAIAIIAGLFVQIPLVLIIMPILLYLFAPHGTNHDISIMEIKTGTH